MRNTAVVFAFSGFQRARGGVFSANFPTKTDVLVQTDYSFANNIKVFYNYCEILKDVSDTYPLVNIVYFSSPVVLNRKIKSLQTKKNQDLMAAKNLYLSKTGKKIARGFKETKEYRSIISEFEKNVKKERKKFSRVFLSAYLSLFSGSVITGKPNLNARRSAGFKNMSFLAFGEIFYKVLSYGDTRVKQIQKDIQTDKRSGYYIIELNSSMF